MLERSGKSRESIRNASYSSGMGYIVLPDDVDRDVYIQTVYRTERIALYIEDAGMVKDAYISRHAIQEVLFPDSEEEKGSLVAWIQEPVKNQLIIVSVISKESDSQLLEENMFKKEVSSDDGSVIIVGKGKTGELFIDIDSKSEDGGNVYINLKNSENSAKFNVNCFGSIKLYTEGKTTIESAEELELKLTNNDTEGETTLNIKKDVGLTYLDEYENSISIDNEGVVKIIPKESLQFFEGGSPLALGDKVKECMDKEIARLDSVISALTSSAVGVQDGGATYKAAITSSIQGLETGDSEFNSDKTFSD